MTNKVSKKTEEEMLPVASGFDFGGVDEDFIAAAEEAGKEQGIDEIPEGGLYYLSLDKNGNFNYRNEALEDTSFHMVILGFGYERRYYTEKYKKDSVAPPACWAVTTELYDKAPDMKPDHSLVSDPQSDLCKNCVHGEYQGACSPYVRLVGFFVGGEQKGKVFNPTEYKSKDLFIARLSPISIKHWKDFVKDVLKQKVNGVAKNYPTYTFITKVWAEPEGDNFVWNFAPVAYNKDLFQDCRERRQEMIDGLTQGYGLRGRVKEEEHEETLETEDSQDMDDKLG